ncbi:tetratricopeptide repeat protein [Anaerobaca lacustris]|uniref:Tetratricopeptide repeat protein n=1 Tax=Anaerobaca lacustris TaxID=3044600 RepID=A0AAW6U5B2_9BACT|nr:tetratricopeptide repeat protein [Sedimentisphaerales bacterium M17dextr]
MRIRAAIILLLVAVGLSGAKGSYGTDETGSSGSREELYALLNEANAAFQQANMAANAPGRAAELYGKAILLYEKIIEQGNVRNAKLYYNLGNAYFLADDIGRAILNYRRALQLDSGDVNVRNNLTFARSRRIDKVSHRTETRVLETLFFWHYDFSLRTRLFLACLSFAGLCLGATAIVWRGRGPVSSAVVVLSGLLWLCLLVSVVVESRERSTRLEGVVTAPQIVARQGDGPNYAPSFKDPLHAGTEFDLIDHRPGWFHIQLADGSKAWVPNTAAEIVQR